MDRSGATAYFWKGAHLFVRFLATLLLLGTIDAPFAAAQTAPSHPGTGFLPTMPLAERINALNSAGYEITPDRHSVFVYCDETKVQNRPVVAQVDVNGDGKVEYLVLGEHKCPGERPVPIKADIVMRDAHGVWQNILSVEGSPKWADGVTAGWRNLVVTRGSRVIAYAHDPAGERYANVSDLQARRNLGLAVRPTVSAPGTLPTAGWTQPYGMGAIPPGDLAAILTAAGYSRTGGKWKGCSGASEVHVFEEDQLAGDGPIIDLNGDGKPEVMVYDESSECYGQAGMAFTIVTPVPGGWKRIFDSGEGMPLVLATKSPGAWRDVVAGGPGFCHRAYRYNGREYADFRSYEETKGACSQ